MDPDPSGSHFPLVPCDGDVEPCADLILHAPDALMVIQDEQLKLVSLVALAQLGCTDVSQLRGLTLAHIIGPDSVEITRALVRQMLASGTASGLGQIQLRTMGGALIDVDVNAAPCQYRGRPAVQFAARAIATGREHSVQRAWQGLHHEKCLLEMIALDYPLAAVLDALCRSVEQVFGGTSRCSVMLPEGAGTLHVAAAPSLPAAFTSAIEGLPIGSSVGSCGTAMFWNRPILVADIATDPLWEAYRTFTLPHGMRACWSTPITNAAGTVLGAFGVYYDEPRLPRPDEVTFIDGVIHLAGVALKKDQVERNLRESEERDRIVVNSLHEGIVVQSRSGIVLTCNPSAERILRVTENSAVGMRRGSHFKRIMDADGLEIAHEDLPTEQVFRTLQPILNVVLAFELMDGEIVWLSVNVVPIYTASETEPRAVLISFTDISTGKMAQQRLQFFFWQPMTP